MHRVSLGVPAVLAAGICFYGCQWSQSRKPAGEARPADEVAVGQTAPDLEGEDTAGRPLHLADYRGRVVVLHFWANW